MFVRDQSTDPRMVELGGRAAARRATQLMNRTDG
jgi:hypothetical protein